MNYEENWKVLADLLIELRKKGEKIPANVMKDLRSAKTMIQILKADPNHIENIPRIETYLRNVESYAIFMANKKLGTEFVDQWFRKLEKLKSVKIEEKEGIPPRIVPSLHRDEDWMRIQISEDTPLEDVEKLAKENRLSCKTQKNGYMLVYGNVEGVKSFVKNLRQLQYSLRKKETKSAGKREKR